MGKKVTLEELQEMIAATTASVEGLADGHRKVAEEQKKTEAAIKELVAEGKKTEAALQDFKEYVKEHGKKLSLSVDHINWRWGYFMENLAEKDLLALLCDRGIQVDKILSHFLAIDEDGHTRKAEYDVVAHNGEEIVVVEVKTTLFGKDIDAFATKLGQFRSYFPDGKITGYTGPWSIWERHGRKLARRFLMRWSRDCY